MFWLKVLAVADLYCEQYACLNYFFDNVWHITDQLENLPTLKKFKKIEVSIWGHKLLVDGPFLICIILSFFNFYFFEIHGSDTIVVIIAMSS